MKIPSKYKIWRYPLFLKIKYFLKCILHREKICITYWINANSFIWDTKIKHYNWGDYINLKFAELISPKMIIPSHYHVLAPKVAMIGSILPWAMDKDTVVWGSGCLNSQDPLWDNVEKPMEVRSVRGPLTREVLLKHGIECPEVYGDPALCFPYYYQPKIPKTHKIGIIPHASNIKQGDYLNITFPNNAIIINPCKFTSWNEFIDQIVSCEIVFSASLHGIIIADAYGIPNVWVSFRGDEHPDNNFKFHDYLLSVGKEIKNPIGVKEINFENIDEYIKSWEVPHLDINKILEVCPLK